MNTDDGATYYGRESFDLMWRRRPRLALALTTVFSSMASLVVFFMR